MADIIEDLAGKAGISADLAKKGLGALLTFVKEKVPAESFSKLTRAIPGADNAMAAAEQSSEASGGVLSAVSGLAGKVFGSDGGASALIPK
jgi:hypothetical protein